MTLPYASRCGVLLAGGSSTRFGGRPKGLARFGEGRVCDGPLGALMATCAQVVIACNDAEAVRWFPSHRVVRDSEPGRGALGALETALLASDAQTVVVCAWDMPFADPMVLAALAGLVDAGAPCGVPVHADGQLEPLCAAYAAGCRSVATALLSRGERAAHALFDAVRGTTWPIADQLAACAADRIFLNVNTMADLEQATRWPLVHGGAS